MNRYEKLIQWCSFALAALCVLLIVRRLPFEAALRAVEHWVGGQGIWGPLVFGLLYVVAVVLLAPASVLTLAAGAVFGTIVGTIVVSLASTTGAALAFLISRYAARERIARRVAQHPRFDAIDKAISQGGWKIVALLRLSPAIPFNVQNYLYGLTGIRFWPCVLTSWLAMLPGTLTYVYLGRVGRAGVEASAGGGRSRSTAEWALLVVGLVATVAVSVYMARLAQRALEQRTTIVPVSEPNRPTSADHTEGNGRPWRAWAAVLIALVALAATAAVYFAPDRMSLWPGPTP